MKRAILAIFVFSALASLLFLPQMPTQKVLAAPVDTQPALYGGCAPPNYYCQLFHPGTEVTGFCAYESCFEMSYGAESRVVAADESGDYPKKFFVWHDGEMTPPPAGWISCELTNQRHKTRTEIPEDQIRCTADLRTTENLYHEHFASNPANRCLGWVECKEPLP